MFHKYFSLHKTGLLHNIFTTTSAYQYKHLRIMFNTSIEWSVCFFVNDANIDATWLCNRHLPPAQKWFWNLEYLWLFTYACTHLLLLVIFTLFLLTHIHFCIWYYLLICSVFSFLKQIWTVIYVAMWPDLPEGV